MSRHASRFITYTVTSASKASHITWVVWASESIKHKPAGIRELATVADWVGISSWASRFGLAARASLYKD